MGLLEEDQPWVGGRVYMCYSSCVLSLSFLEEHYELFLEGCLPRVCSILGFDDLLAPGAARLQPEVGGLPPAPAVDQNLLLLFLALL